MSRPRLSLLSLLCCVGCCGCAGSLWMVKPFAKASVSDLTSEGTQVQAIAAPESSPEKPPGMPVETKASQPAASQPAASQPAASRSAENRVARPSEPTEPPRSTDLAALSGAVSSAVSNAAVNRWTGSLAGTSPVAVPLPGPEVESPTRPANVVDLSISRRLAGSRASVYSGASTPPPISPAPGNPDGPLVGESSAIVAASATSPLAVQSENVQGTAAVASPSSVAPSALVAKLAPPPDHYKKGAWRRLTAEARAQLDHEKTRDKPAGRDGQVLEITSRLLHLIGNDPQQAAQEIGDLNDDEREFWKHQIYALSVAVDAEGKHAESRRAALALRELRSAMDHLQNLSTLDVRNLAICEKVESYGRYTPFKTGSFKPGQEFLLYVEIDNFAVEEVGERFRTELRAEYHITDADGRRINNQLPPTTEECRNRRRDYFIAYTLAVPKELRPGTYTLQLTIEDVIGRKSSQGAIEFRVR